MQAASAATKKIHHGPSPDNYPHLEIEDGTYAVRFARGLEEIEAANPVKIIN